MPPTPTITAVHSLTFSNRLGKWKPHLSLCAPLDRFRTCLGLWWVTEQQQKPQEGGELPLSWAAVGSHSGRTARGTGRGDQEARLEPGLRCEASKLKAAALNKGLTVCQQWPPSQQLKPTRAGRQHGASVACCQSCRRLTVFSTSPLKTKPF